MTILNPPFSTHVEKNLHFLLWEHMDFNGSKIQVMFIVLARINISRNYWKFSLNKLDTVLSKEGRTWFIKFPVKYSFFLQVSFLFLQKSQFSFREGKKKVIWYKRLQGLVLHFYPQGLRGRAVPLSQQLSKALWMNHFILVLPAALLGFRSHQSHRQLGCFFTKQNCTAIPVGLYSEHYNTTFRFLTLFSL